MRPERPKGARLALLLAAAACSLSLARPPRAFQYSRPLMHTVWDFTLVERDEARARAAFEAAAAEVERLDLALAMWRPDSELAAFNARAGQGPQAVSADLDAVLSLGLKAAELSRGASDPSVGPLVQLWYDSLRQGREPAPAALRAARSRVGYRRLRRHGDGRWSGDAGTRADLGSFAKGYAQDQAAALLLRHGIPAFLLNAGGQVYAKGRKPDGSPWKVGIQHPRDEGRVVAVVPLIDQAMATAGDYEQSRTLKGRRYHHILDPRTGAPTAHGTCSVTVILPLAEAPAPGAGAWCDALDTAALVLGQADGAALLEGFGAQGLLLREHEGRLSAAGSPGLVAGLEL